jgi:hypothetical protein
VWTILVEDSAVLSDTRVAGVNGVIISSARVAGWADWSTANVAVWSQCVPVRGLRKEGSPKVSWYWRWAGGKGIIFKGEERRYQCFSGRGLNGVRGGMINAYWSQQP